jgi:hypothetical protein
MPPPQIVRHGFSLLVVALTAFVAAFGCFIVLTAAVGLDKMPAALRFGAGFFGLFMLEPLLGVLVMRRVRAAQHAAPAISMSSWSHRASPESAIDTHFLFWLFRELKRVSAQESLPVQLRRSARHLLNYMKVVGLGLLISVGWLGIEHALA